MHLQSFSLVPVREEPLRRNINGTPWPNVSDKSINETLTDVVEEGQIIYRVYFGWAVTTLTLSLR